MKRAHVSAMTELPFARIVVLAVVLAAAALVAGCSGIPQDGRYQTHDGGRSNTRAEAPATTRLS